MSLLGTKLRSFGQAVSAVTESQAIKDFNALAKAKPGVVESAMAKAGQKLGATMRNMLVQNYGASGLGGKSKKGATGLRAAMNQAVINVQPTKVMVYLPSGLQFSDGKGSVYAAAGAFKWGAVRQPLTKAKGSLYKDLPTGQYVPRKTAAGEYGEKAKRTIKASALGGAGLKGKAYKALHTGGVTVIAPKPPFFTTTASQNKQLQDEWFGHVKAALKSLGIRVS